MDYGSHIDVPLPTGVDITSGRLYGDAFGEFFLLYVGGFMGEYSLDPPPNEDKLRADMGDWIDDEDADQVIDYLKIRKWVLS